MNWIVATLAVVAAFDTPQRCRQLREASQRDRIAVAVGALAAAIALAGVATPLLDALDISGPNLEIGAGVVLAIYSVVAIVRWDDAPAPPATTGGLLPLLVPIVLTPAVGVVVLAVAARNGMPVPVIAAMAAAALLAWPGVDDTVGRRNARMVSATVGIVAGVVMIVDGAFAV